MLLLAASSRLETGVTFTFNLAITIQSLLLDAINNQYPSQDSGELALAEERR